MDTTARRRKSQKLYPENFRNQFSQSIIDMYDIPPGNEISLSEFEELALERLQVLRILDQATIKGHRPFSEEWKLCIKEDLVKANLKKYIRLMSDMYSTHSEEATQARRADRISHFILRLAYCRSEELRRWFLARELEWFKLRFLAQSHENVIQFLKDNNFTYTPISAEEKQQIREDLYTSTSGISDFSLESIDFFKVPFVDVIPIVKARKTFLKGGFAFIPSEQLIVTVQSKFRAKLSESLNIANRRLPALEDDRINLLLSNLHNAYTGRDYAVTANKDAIDPANLDKFSKQHFPLCMRHIHEVLRANHHLKHHCRLIYGLFLKGIGLLYEDAMAFWREEFTKIIDGNKFDKDYSYGIRHTYGRAGQQINYSPFSCIKIISYNVGPGEQHGCPFKHWDSAILKKKMGEYGMGSEDVQTIMELVSNGHFQIACSKYFEITHGQPPTTAINHPNQYFENSINIMKDKQPKV